MLSEEASLSSPELSISRRSTRAEASVTSPRQCSARTTKSMCAAAAALPCDPRRAPAAAASTSTSASASASASASDSSDDAGWRLPAAALVGRGLVEPLLPTRFKLVGSSRLRTLVGAASASALFARSDRLVGLAGLAASPEPVGRGASARLVSCSSAESASIWAAEISSVASSAGARAPCVAGTRVDTRAACCRHAGGETSTHTLRSPTSRCRWAASRSPSSATCTTGCSCMRASAARSTSRHSSVRVRVPTAAPPPGRAAAAEGGSPGGGARRSSTV